MDKLLSWFREYNSEITWWLIGFLTWAVIDSIVRESYIIAAINAALIYVNYRLWKSSK